MLPFFVRSGIKQISGRSAIRAFFGGIFFGIELAFWNQSIILSNATFPTLLVNLSVIWTAIGATLLLGERMTLNHWAGNVLALLGVAVLIGVENILHLQIGIGFVYAIAASIFLAGYILIVKRARRNAPTLPVISVALLGSTVTLLVICLLNGAPLTGFSGASWLYLLALGLIVQVGGYFSINFALGYIDSTKVSLLTLLQPVLTAIFAILLLGERFENHLWGGIIVLSGLAVALVKNPLKNRTPAELIEKA